jgi:glycosyltransferase involved in cell wall biosynthesis
VKLLLVEPLAHTPGYFEEYTRCLSQSLVAGGVEISLVTFDGLVNNAQPVAGVRHMSFVEEAGRQGRACRFLLKLIPFRSFREVCGELLGTVCCLGAALRIARRESFDVIHVPGVALPELFYPLFALFQRKRNIVYSLWIHSREEDVKGWGARFRDAVRHLQMVRCLRLLAGLAIAGRPGIAVTNWLCRRAMKRNCLTFISNSPAITATYARAPFRDRIVLIPMAVHSSSAAPVSKAEARQYLDIPQEQLMLLHFGTNHAYKDFPSIFAALADLALDYRLVFAGRVLPQYRENDPARLVREHHLELRTTVIDRFIPDAEIPYYFCAADAVILSHLRGFGSVSGVLYVAAQYGVPAITADAGDDGDLVCRFDLGITYRAESPEALRQAILRFSRLTVEERREMARSIARFARQNSWQKVAEAHARLYEAAIRGDVPQGLV